MHLKMRRLIVAVTLLLVLSACGRKHRTTAAAPPPPPAPEFIPAPVESAQRRHGPRPTSPAEDGETGLASWYGRPYHGRQAADGEIYDMETMVAAHRTLPFQTRVRVENLDNGRSVEVRIIDRGPFIAGRIIDLSHAAAREVQLIGPGVARVKLHLISEPPAVRPAVYGVQVGAFAQRTNAERLMGLMRERFGYARIVRRDGDPVLWRVVAGEEPTSEAAEALRGDLDRSTFVVRIDSLPAN
jgi:rare lipoprotein A